MLRDRLGAMDRARELVGTPLALEILDDLANGRSPYARPDGTKVIAQAVRCLQSLGAARVVLQAKGPSPMVQLTPRGRRLYDRLVEIEEWAARCEPLSTSTP
jgi:DNA-binding HxlR family transcriptional regulator